MTRHFRIAAVAVVLTASTAVDAQTTHFTLSSTDVRHGGRLAAAQEAKVMDCTGGNISPELHWLGAPPQTKSYAVTLYDPDAPTGSGWWHWVVYNIPANVAQLATGAGDPAKNLLPAGAAQGNTDVGSPGFLGACPAKGDKTHHYIFTVHALDTDKLDIPQGATSAIARFNIYRHAIGKATLTAFYGRK